MAIFHPFHLSMMSMLLTRSATAPVAAILFGSLWQGSLLVLLVALGLRLLPGLTSSARAAVWAVMVLVIAVHPVLALVGHGSAEPVAGLVHAELGVSVALVAVWGLASLFRLFQLAISGAELWRTLRAAQPLGAPAAVAALLRESPRRPSLCSSATLNRPCVAGFWRPRVLLPADLLPTLNEAEITQIVLHELEHLRRGDDWINLLQQVALVILPLHPALFWVNRRLALERELACDDAVLAKTRAGKAYAACLAHVAEQSLMRRGLSLAVGALGSWRRRPELAARVERILRRPERTLTGMPLRLATGLVLAGTVVAGGVLAGSPTLVSFGDAAPLDASTAVGISTGPRMMPVTLRTPLLASGARLSVLQPRPHLHPVLRPVLLKTAMAVSGSPSRVQRRLVEHRSAALRSVPARRMEPRGPQVLLTEWRADAASDSLVGSATAAPDGGPRWVAVMYAPQMAPVVLETRQVWYAAVRAVETPSGWLVVQL